MFKLESNYSNIEETKPVSHTKRNLLIIGLCIFFIYLLNNIYYTYSPNVANDQTRFFWLFLKTIYSPYEIPFLTRDIFSCLWSINLYLFITLLGHFSFLFNYSVRYVRWVNISINLSGILAIVLIFIVFPFYSGSSYGTWFFKIALITCMLFPALNLTGILLAYLKK